MKTASPTTEARVLRVAAIAVGLMIALGASYVLYRAIVLRIDYWDSYLYMNNTRRMLGDVDARYTLDKPPLLPALYLPVVMYIRQFPAQVVQYIVPHLYAFALSMLSLGAIWLAFRRALPTLLASAGVVLLMGNRVFAHYAAFSLTDICAVGLIGLVFAAWFVARERRSWGWFTLVGLLIGAAVSTRYQNATLPFGIAAAELLLSVRLRRIPDRRALGFVYASVLGAIVFLFIHQQAFTAIDREFSVRSMLEALEFAGAGATRQYEREAPWQYFRMLPIAMSWIVIGLAAIGFVVALVQRRDHDALFAAWLLIIAGGIFRVDHNEIRYLYPAFPPLVYFAMRAVEAAARWRTIRSWLATRSGAWAGLAIGLGALVLGAWPGVAQAIRDQHPFFVSDQFRAGAAWILERREARPNSRVLWYGRPHTLFPPNPMQFEDDEYFNIFHHYAHILEFFMGGPQLEERRWDGRSPEQIAIGDRGRPLIMFYGTPDDLHAWEVEVVDETSRPMHIYATIPRVLTRTAEGFGDRRGLVLRQTDRGLVSEVDARAAISEPGRPPTAFQMLRRGQRVSLTVGEEVERLDYLELEETEVGVNGDHR
ncbi:MAG: glycosyltransferase family 39 protein [Sandaracinaceae bacterium]